MEQKKEIKKSLKVTIIISAIILAIALIIAICVGIKAKRNNNIDKTPGNIVENNEKENEQYSEAEGFCRIIGKNSNLLYKNEYESDTSYLEKVIYLDEESKQHMTGTYDAIDVDEVLYRGKFVGEFIGIKYGTDDFDYSMSLAYMRDEGFYKCTTNKIIKKAFDKSGNEIDIPIPKHDIIPYDNSTCYALLDITTDDGVDYIVGMYNKVFSKDNPNVVLLTIALKKENVKIDMDDEKQVKEFWNKYASYEIEEATKSVEGDYEKVDIDGKTYFHRLTDNTWDGEYKQSTYNTSSPNNIQEVVSYDDYLEHIDKVNKNIEKHKKIPNYYKDKNSNYIILSCASGFGWCEMELIDCKEENNQIIIYGDQYTQGAMSSGSGYFIAIPTDMPVGTKVEYRECYSTSEISDLKNYGNLQPGISMDY